MSIIISDLSYHYPNQYLLFNHLNFSVGNREKVSLIGNNGTGKSTLLKLIAGDLNPVTGSVLCHSKPYYISQHVTISNQTVAEALGVGGKLKALESITKGSLLQDDYDILNNDWDIESKCQSALAYWNLADIDFQKNINSLSGGERTKVFLAGLLVHKPEIILFDEPSNDLDQEGRSLLYQFITQSASTIVVVSHDVTLLELLSVTCELSQQTIKRYGGNYFFYKAQKELEINALDENIHAEEKTLRLARKKAQEMRERQEKRSNQATKSNTNLPRIVRNSLHNAAENTASKLAGKHAEIVGESQDQLLALKKQQARLKDLKIDFDNTKLHAGKLLIDAQKINIAYFDDHNLWETPIDFQLYSNDRIHIEGCNGSGKTTLIRLLTGALVPSIGEIKRFDFNWIYLDQHYEQVNVDCSVEQLAETYNLRKLEDHEVKLRLNRFLFPADTWDKNCKELSGGEKMRLYLCCLMIGNQTPDLIILDEPTNNLDINSLQILMRTIKNYDGSLLVVSHDKHFVAEIGVKEVVRLSCSMNL